MTSYSYAETDMENEQTCSRLITYNCKLPDPFEKGPYNNMSFNKQTGFNVQSPFVARFRATLSQNYLKFKLIATTLACIVYCKHIPYLVVYYSTMYIHGFGSVRTVLTGFEPIQPVLVKPIREKYHLSSHWKKRIGLLVTKSDLMDSDSRILAQIRGFMNENTVECTKIHKPSKKFRLPRHRLCIIFTGAKFPSA